MQFRKVFVVLVLLIPCIGVSAEPSFEEKAFVQGLSAIQSGSLKNFVALGDEQFQKMPEAEFKKTTTKFSPLLKAGYLSTYLGVFKDTTVRVHYWKLEFPGESHDWLAKIAVANNQLKGFFITRP